MLWMPETVESVRTNVRVYFAFLSKFTSLEKSKTTYSLFSKISTIFEHFMVNHKYALRNVHNNSNDFRSVLDQFIVPPLRFRRHHSLHHLGPEYSTGPRYPTAVP